MNITINFKIELMVTYTYGYVWEGSYIGVSGNVVFGSIVLWTKCQFENKIGSQDYKKSTKVKNLLEK